MVSRHGNDMAIERFIGFVHLHLQLGRGFGIQGIIRGTEEQPIFIAEECFIVITVETERLVASSPRFQNSTTLVESRSIITFPLRISAGLAELVRIVALRPRGGM